MATYGWKTDHSVADWLFAEGHRFDFYQAVKLLELLYPDGASVGAGTDPAQEAVHFSSTPGLKFPASDIAHILPPSQEDSPAELAVNFLGLGGSFGPLPTSDTERIIDQIWHKDTAARDFLDLFHHRLVSLMYRVKKAHRLSLIACTPDETPISNYLYSLIGLGSPSLQHRLQLNDRALLLYAGLLAQRPRSMTGLTKLLAHYFDVSVEGTQFRGQWHILEEHQLTTIGRTGQNHRLGSDVVLGKRVWDQEGKFELTIGPMNFDDFVNLLPIGWGFIPLCELTQFYAGHEFDVGFRLLLNASSVPVSRLNSTSGPRLGWTSWLHTRQGRTDDAEVRVSPGSLPRHQTTLRVPLFAKLPLDELTQVVRGMTTHNFPAGHVIVRQDDTGDSLFIIKRGTARVVIHRFDGKEQHVAFLGSHDFFGEMSLLTGKPRRATVVAVKDSEILELSKTDLDRVTVRYPRVREVMEAYAETRSKVFRDSD